MKRTPLVSFCSRTSEYSAQNIAVTGSNVNCKRLKTFTEGQFIVERAVYVMQCSRKVMWVFLMGTVNIHFIVCSSVYRICSDRTCGKYEYGTILVSNRVNTFHSL